MAIKENRGYLITICVLSIYCLCLTLGNVFGWSKVSEYHESKLAAEANFNKILKLERTLCQAHEIKANVLATMIGARGSVAEIQAQLETLTRLAGHVDEGDRRQVNAIATSLGQIKAIYDADMESNLSSGAAHASEPTYMNLVANLNSVVAKKHKQ